MSNLQVRDGQSTIQYMMTSGEGTVLAPFSSVHSPYYLHGALGRITGVTSVHVFGNAADIDSGDNTVNIWDGTCDQLAGDKIPTYTFSDTANITDIGSTDDGDTVDVEIEGLDTNWNMVKQTVTLTGQTVKLLSTPLIRVFSMVNRGTVDILGTIYLTTSSAVRTVGVPNDSTTVRAIIKDGDNQTQMAIYSVPAGYRLAIDNGWANISRKIATNATIVVKLREFGGVFRVLHTFSLNSVGSSGDHRPYNIPLILPEKSDLIYTASVSDNNSGVSSGFHGMLIPN